MLRYTSLAGLALVAVVPALPEIKVGEPEMRLDALLPSQPVANGTHPALAGKAVVISAVQCWTVYWHKEQGC